MQSHKLLITGGRGFTGCYVANLLNTAGWEVHNLVQGEPRERHDHAGDLRDGASVAQVIDSVRPTHVLHLAGRAFPADADHLAFYDVHARGTENLLAALGQHADRIEKVILASSAAVYGDPGPDPAAESLCPAPRNHYACSKLSMEHLARLWDAQLPIIIARPFNYTGPGQDSRFLVPKVVSHFTRREPVIELGNLDVERDFSDVRDVAAMYHALLESTARALTVNLCSGRALSLEALLALCREVTGHSPEIRSSAGLQRAADVPRLVGDGTRLDALTGPLQRRPLRQTVIDMCRARSEVGH